MAELGFALSMGVKGLPKLKGATRPSTRCLRNIGETGVVSIRKVMREQGWKSKKDLSETLKQVNYSQRENGVSFVSGWFYEQFKKKGPDGRMMRLIRGIRSIGGTRVPMSLLVRWQAISDKWMVQAALEAKKSEALEDKARVEADQKRSRVDEAYRVGIKNAMPRIRTLVVDDIKTQMGFK